MGRPEIDHEKVMGGVMLVLIVAAIILGYFIWLSVQ